MRKGLTTKKKCDIMGLEGWGAGGAAASTECAKGDKMEAEGLRMRGTEIHSFPMCRG